MAKLRVSLHGQILTELHLQPGQEYFAGRGSQCQILLANERGISRQHIKFYQDGGVWLAQLTSKYGGLIFDGQSMESIQLVGELRFSVPPYEFHFNDVAETDENAPAPATAAEAQLFENNELPVDSETADIISNSASISSPSQSSQDRIEPAPDNNNDPAGNLDATAVGVTTLIAYLKIQNNKTRTEEILKLEGNMWTAGRHPSCEIIIKDSAISRKHFDLTRTPEGYFVTDYGSSNGTKINGEKIPPETQCKLVSGDVITVRHIEIIFEIHDSSFENKLSGLPQISEQSMVYEASPNPDAQYEESQSNLPMAYHHPETPSALRIPPPAKQKKFIGPLNKVQAAIAALAIVLIVGLVFTGSKSSSPSSNPNGQAENSSKGGYNELNPDKRKEIADTFNLAQNYYLQRKYVLCLSQVEKLHSLVPFYLNSKELDNLCRQAQELEQIEKDRQTKEEKRAEVENRIRKTVEECRAQLTAKTTLSELNTCLQPAVELDPGSILVTELQAQVQIQENEIRSKYEKHLEFTKRKQEGQALFNRAMSQYKSGQLKTALSTFKTFVRGRYPGLNQEDDQANRSIASISKTLDNELQAQISKCQSSLNNADLKGAIVSCERVLKENPGNKEATSIRQQAFSQLRREMKALYEDSRIEESLGNIEAAKEKWMKIVEKSVPQDDYYQKAKKSLKKYGIGM